MQLHRCKTSANRVYTCSDDTNCAALLTRYTEVLGHIVFDPGEFIRHVSADSSCVDRAQRRFQLRVFEFSPSEGQDM